MLEKEWFLLNLEGKNTHWQKPNFLLNVHPKIQRFLAVYCHLN